MSNSNKNMKRRLFFLIAVLLSGFAHSAPPPDESDASEAESCAGEDCPSMFPPRPDGRVSLRFSSVKIRSLLSILGDVSGLYIYATQSVDGFTSLRVNDAPWEQVLKNLVGTHRWVYRQNGDSIIVGPEAEVDWVIEHKVFW